MRRTYFFMRARTIIIWCALVPQRREKERVAGGRRFPPDLLLSAVNRAFFFTPL